MHTTIDYMGQTRGEADAKAIADTRKYLGSSGMRTVIEALLAIRTGKDFEHFAIGMSLFAGVEGRPVQALGRKYCLAAWREYMHTEPDARATDEEGFVL